MAFLLAVTLMAPPAQAQEAPTPKDGAEALAEGFRLLLEGLASEMEPLADDMTEIWRDFLNGVEELPAYDPPEVLPNGDIIIRRKSDTVPPKTETDGIEL